MSTLLEQASLIMIPSGYKEDVVYSVIPENGNGDLSFTRASNGTRINSAGLVEVCPWNLAEYSEDFTNGWPISATITANTTANPINGATNADTITGTGYVGRNIASIGVNTFFVYAKANSASVIRLNVYDGAIDRGADYNLTTGAISGVYGSPISTNAENVGNGWWKISITTNNASYSFVQIHRDSSGTCFIWGAQLNIGSTAKPYFPTTDRLNVPRLTYQNGGGGCPSLLLEKQSTNLTLYSEQFDNASWTKNSTSVTANTATSPDGTQNADTINSISASPNIVSNVATFTSTTNVSMFVKYVSQQWVMLMSGGAVNDYANFDIQNGVIGSVGSTASNAQIQNFGNGWYRISVTFSGYSGNSNLYFGFIASGTSGWNTFDPNFNKSVYAWGCQIENSSYPTSYIPTTSASATRVADACFKTGISSLIGQTSGTVFWDLQVDQLLSSENILNIDNGSFGNTIYFAKTASGGIIVEVYVGGTAQCSLSYSLPSVGRYKMAIGYANNNTAFFVNGVQVGTTDTSCSVPAMSRLQMDNTIFGPSDGKVNQTILFPTRLTNSELASLTTI